MDTANTADAANERKLLRPNLILGICCMSVLLLTMDVTIVNVALPAIQHDLHATFSQLQWVVDAYTLVVASLLMLAGAISDRFGRRRVFLIGLVLFTAGSWLCSVAPNIEGLVAFRVMQGLGASMLNPVALSIIVNSIRDPKMRARAIGIWGAVAGLSFALGPVLGGALTQAVGWRSIFWINLPLGLIAVVLATLFVPESKAKQARSFDPVGQALVFLILASLCYGVIEGPHAGWHAHRIIGLFATCAVALVCFLLYEPRRREPLLDLRFFRSVPFSSATLLAVLSFASFAGFLFLNAIYLQQVRGLSALRTGLYTLPLAVMMMLTAPLSGRLVGSHGTRASILLSGSGLLASTLLLTQLSGTTSVALLLFSYLLFGIGLGMINPAIANNAVAGMPLSQAGVASAIASTSRQVGAALGVAVAGTVVNASRTHGTDFSRATHPIWWIMVSCSVGIVVLGWASNTPWSRQSADKVAHLLGDAAHS
ncbi:DHA2 family efflux MFS transporter permease subunit [Acidipila sp. EB88]|nr:DHA2 family efflux MFS transporter permease subunit [Acidipila sp. EB88]